MKLIQHFRIMVVNNNSGQALFEFLIFIPVLLIISVLMVSMGNAINGSINQQKATRRYFFYIVKNNSNFPLYNNLNIYRDSGLELAGMLSIGWAEKIIGESRYSTCYKVAEFGESSDETCDSVNTDENNSRFIRVYTAYGICGQTYNLGNDGVFRKLHTMPGILYSNSCTVR